MYDSQKIKGKNLMRVFVSRVADNCKQLGIHIPNRQIPKLFTTDTDVKPY